jgi:predicted alternative tryptophan synthase beta-subunit
VSAHAVQAAIRKPLPRESGTVKNNFIQLSGTGMFDFRHNDLFLTENLRNYPLPEIDLKESLKNCPR